MNSFVRDGAVYRKRRARLSLTTRDNEPPSEKIRRTDDCGATGVPCALEESNPRIYGESSVRQSAVEKESRYQNIEFMRAKAFLYLNYKKMSTHNVNKLLKEHLKKFDENETQLKRIFEQCYDLTGSVEKSKAMMKDLETAPCVRLFFGTKLTSEISNRVLSTLSRKVVEKSVQNAKQTMDKKSLPISLKKIIGKTIIKCFGKDHYKNDQKILFSKITNDYNKTPITDYNSDTSIISDIDIGESFCRLTKFYSVFDPEINSLGINEMAEANTDGIDGIVLEHSNLLSNSQLNTDTNVQNAGFALGTNIDLEEITFPRLVIDECNQNAFETNVHVGKITIPRLMIDEGVQNTKDSTLKTINDVEEITFPRLVIDECSQNALETNIDVEEITIPRLMIDEGVQNTKDSTLKTINDVEEIAFPRLIINEGVQNTKDSTLKTNTDVEEITFPRLVIEECNQNALETNIDVEEITIPRIIIDEGVQNTKDSTLKTNTNVEEIAFPRLIINEGVQNTKDSTLKTITDVEEITFPRLVIDECNQNALETNIDVEEITIPRIIIDEGVQNTKDSTLKTNTDVEEIAFPRLVIDECSQNALETNIDVEEITVPRFTIEEGVKNTKDSALKNNTDVEEIAFPRLVIDECSQNALETNIDVEEITVPRLTIEEGVKNTKDSALKNNTDVEEIAFPRLVIDECSQNALETNIDVEEITVPRLTIEEGVKNTKDSALKNNTDVEEITLPRLVIDECSQNALETNIDVEEITVPRLIIDEGVQNTKDSALKNNTDVEEITLPRLVIDECSQNTLETNIDVEEITVPRLIIDEGVQNTNDSTLKTNTDVEKITFPQLKKDECSQNPNGVITIGEVIDSALIKYVSTQDLVNSHSTVLNIDMDIAHSNKQSELLDHTNIELIIREMLNPDDEVFNCSIIKDLTTYFLNNDFLSKIDKLWKTTESKLVGELIIQLLNKFNDTNNNMAQFTGCLICIFREIAQKSSIPPCQMKLKLIMFLDAIKKYIKFYDNGLWRTWFLPSMFFDWCFIVGCIFMNTKNEFKIDLNKSVIRNATEYYKLVKKSRYLFILQDSKPSKSHKKTGIFELTRIDDLLEIDDVHAINDTIVMPDLSTNLPSNELERETLETDDNCLDTINETSPGNIEEVCPAPVTPKISVRPEFTYSNSFIKKSNWFTGPISEIIKKWSKSMSNGSFESSTVQNNSTVDKNKEPSVNKRQNATIKPTKCKKSKTEFESPRVFFTIANNPTEFDITYGSSSIPQMSSSSVVAQMSRSSTVPQMSRSSTVPQMSRSSVVPQMSRSSIVPQMSSSSVVAQRSRSTVVPQMSRSSLVPQMSSSSVLAQMSRSSVVPQMSRSSLVAQMLSSSVIPQISSSSAVSQANLQITNSLEVSNMSNSSAIPQMSRSSVVPQMSRSSIVPQMSSSSVVAQRSRSTVVPQMSRSSAIPQMSRSSVVPQNLSSSAISQNMSPYYNNFSPSNTGSQSPVTPISRNLSKYYNNIVSNVTQAPFGLQRRQSISNTTRSSNARVMNPPVDKNITSTLHSFYSNIQPSIPYQHSTTINSQLPKAANTWPSNTYSNLCSDPSYSKSSTYRTEYINSAPSYPQSQHNHCIPPATSHPQHSNALAYPSNYTQPISSDLLTGTTAMASAMNSYMEHQNYNYGNSCSSQNNFHNTQVSPDLPDARLPNMPNHQDSNFINKTCMAANCTNTSNFSCNACMAAFYCCTQCQKSDWHYHQNKCHFSF